MAYKFVMNPKSFVFNFWGSLQMSLLFYAVFQSYLSLSATWSPPSPNGYSMDAERVLNRCSLVASSTVTLLLTLYHHYDFWHFLRFINFLQRYKIFLIYANFISQLYTKNTKKWKNPCVFQIFVVILQRKMCERIIHDS